MKKHYYTIGEVCNLLDLKPYIIRYWESEFPDLKSSRSKGATRRYSLEKVELIKNIRDMLYVQKFTVKGVKSKLAKMKGKDKYNTSTNKAIINDNLKKSLVDKLADVKNILEKIEEKQL